MVVKPRARIINSMRWNRREFVAAGAAAGAAALLPRNLFGAPVPLSTAPIPHEMEKAFAPLSASLLPVEAWKPFPKIEDRAGWAALPADVRAALVERADAALHGDWPQLTASLEMEFERVGNRADFEAIYFARRVRLDDLVLGECVAAEGKYLDQIANGIWLICEESSWSLTAHLAAQKSGVGLADVTDPIIDLFAAETGAQMAWIAYLLESALDKVSPLLAKRIRLEETRRILDVFLVRDHGWEGLDGKPHHLNNWNPWINSNLLTTVLLLETDSRRREQLVLKSCRSLDAYLEDVSPDGGCEEGPGYWNRSAASLLDCCDTLVSAYGGKGAEVKKTAYLRAAGRYIADVHIAKNYYVDYGDAHVTDAPAPELVYRFGKATDDPVLRQFGAYDSAEHGMLAGGARMRSTVAASGGLGSLSRELSALFVVNEMRNVPRKDALTRDAWYPVLGLMTARVKDGSDEGFFLALQAASNGRSHAHNDSGSFIVFFNGEPVFIDVGVGQYTKQTFSKDRYKIWTMQSAYHNLPTIGGVMQHEGGQFRAKVLDYKRGDAATSIAVDLAGAYPAEAGIRTWKRSMTLDRAADRIVLHEAFRLAKAVPVEMSFMTMVEPQVSESGVRVGGMMLAFDPKQLTARAGKVAMDAHMEHSFPRGVWRVLVSSANEVAEGDWRLEMRGA